MEKSECKNHELEKGSYFCTHFIGDIFHTYHISKCYKYCSYSEAKSLIQNNEHLKSVHNTLKQKVKKQSLSRNNRYFYNGNIVKG